MKKIKKLLDSIANSCYAGVRRDELPIDHPERDNGYPRDRVDVDWSMCTFWMRMGVLSVLFGMGIVVMVGLSVVYLLFTWIPTVMVSIFVIAAIMALIAKGVK